MKQCIALLGSVAILQGCSASPDPLTPVQTGLKGTLTCFLPAWPADLKTPLVALPQTPLQNCGSYGQQLGKDTQLWQYPQDKQRLLTSLDRSIGYLQSARAVQAYENYPIKGITRDRVLRSLQRFKTLLSQAQTPEALQAAVEKEFTFYQATGQDHLGTVLYSGYFEPIYAASPVPTTEYRYPLYKRPPDLDQWPRPHPTRQDLEGEDGTGSEKMKGLELYWLRSRWEAYLVHIQGSARLTLPDGREVTIGYE